MAIGYSVNIKGERDLEQVENHGFRMTKQTSIIMIILFHRIAAEGEKTKGSSLKH